jgi:hypothetical protein
LTEAEYDLFEQTLTQAAAPARSAARSIVRNGTAAAKMKPIHWPAKLFPGELVAKEKHVVVALTLSHEKKEDKS